MLSAAWWRRSPRYGTMMTVARSHRAPPNAKCRQQFVRIRAINHAGDDRDIDNGAGGRVDPAGSL